MVDLNLFDKITFYVLCPVAVALSFYNMITHSYFPKTDKVQQGYVVPSKLEIKVKDINNDGKKETLMSYGDKTYLLTLDKQGKPAVQDYVIEVKPKN